MIPTMFEHFPCELLLKVQKFARRNARFIVQKLEISVFRVKFINQQQV